MHPIKREEIFLLFFFGIEIWNTPKKDSKHGWLGIFNRTADLKSISLEHVDLGLSNNSQYVLSDVWNEKTVNTLDFDINPNGVVFLKYTQK